MVYILIFFIYFLNVFNTSIEYIKAISVHNIIIKALVWIQTMIDICWKIAGVDRSSPVIITEKIVNTDKMVNKKYTFTIREESIGAAAAAGASDDAEAVSDDEVRDDEVVSDNNGSTDNDKVPDIVSPVKEVVKKKRGRKSKGISAAA